MKAYPEKNPFLTIFEQYLKNTRNNKMVLLILLTQAGFARADFGVAAASAAG